MLELLGQHCLARAPTVALGISGHLMMDNTHPQREGASSTSAARFKLANIAINLGSVGEGLLHGHQVFVWPAAVATRAIPSRILTIVELPLGATYYTLSSSACQFWAPYKLAPRHKEIGHFGLVACEVPPLPDIKSAQKRPC